MAVYGAEVCGELLDEAIWFNGITGDRGAAGATFQRGGQLRSAGSEPSDRHDGAIGERARAQIQESRVLTPWADPERNKMANHATRKSVGPNGVPLSASEGVCVLCAVIF